MMKKIPSLVLLVAIMLLHFNSKAQEDHIPPPQKYIIGNCDNDGCDISHILNSGFEISTGNPNNGQITGDFAAIPVTVTGYTSYNSNDAASLCSWHAFIGHPTLFGAACTGSNIETVNDPVVSYVPVVPFISGSGSGTVNTHDGATNPNNTNFVGMRGGYDANTSAWNYGFISTNLDMAYGDTYYLSFWARDIGIGTSGYTNAANPIAFYVVSPSTMSNYTNVNAPAQLSGSVSGALPSALATPLLSGTISDPNWVPVNGNGYGGYFNVAADNSWHLYTASFTYNGPNGSAYILVGTPTNQMYSHNSITTPSASVNTYVLLDDVQMIDNGTPSAPTLAPLTLTTSPSTICGSGMASYTITGTNGAEVTLTTDGGATTTTVTLGGLSTLGSYTSPSFPVSTTTTIALQTYFASWTSCSAYSVNNTATITVSAPPTASIPSQLSVCAGSDASISMTGTNAQNATVTYTVNGVTHSTPLNGSSGTIDLGILPQGTYTVTLTGITNSGGCTGTVSGTTTVTVNAIPAITIYPSNALNVCAGNSQTLYTDGSASSYTWSPSGTLNTSSGTTVIATPTATTTYTVTATTNGCHNTAQATLTVIPLPTVSVSSQYATICQGSTDVLTATGNAASYSWYPAATLNTSTGSTVTATPTTTTAYTVIGTTNGCPNSAQVTVDVNPAPSFSISGGGSICYGASTTLAASVPSYTYSWTPATGLSATTGYSVVATPAANIVYTATATNPSTGCKFSTPVGVGVTNPAFAITGPNSECSGTSSNILVNNPASDVITCTPITGITPLGGGVYALSPATTTTYTVTGTLGACTYTQPFTMTILPSPVVTVSATSTSICDGQSTSLSATGADIYSWTPFATLSSAGGTPVTATPTATTTYMVTGKKNSDGCTNSQSITINVNTATAFTVSSKSSICYGTNTLMTLSNSGDTYSFTPTTGVTQESGNTYLLNPTSTTTYSITGSNGSGCTYTVPFTMTVLPLPTIAATAATNPICVGQSTSLTATGGTTYTWSPSATLSAATGNPVTATPGATTTYTITGAGANGCVGTGTLTLTVNPNPTVTIYAAPNPVCSGSPVSFTAEGATSYVWTGSNLTGTLGYMTTGRPTTNSTYTVTGTYNGCTSTSSILITTLALPTITVTPVTAVVCVSTGTTLTASGGVSYHWNPSTYLSGVTGASVMSHPTAPIEYQVEGFGANGCANVATSSLSVNHSCRMDGGSESTETVENENVNYVVSPNPSTGTITIAQSKEDDKPVNMEITDVAGRIIYKQQAVFSDKTYKVNLVNAADGLYILHLINSAGNSFTFKLIITN